MPKFLDSHHMKGVDENTLRNAQDSPKDEFGVTHENIMYNEKKINYSVFLMHPVKKRLKNIIKNLEFNVNGLLKSKQQNKKLLYYFVVLTSVIHSH